MLRVTGGLPISNRARTILLAIAAFVALSIAAPSAAHASGCTNSWTNTAGGSWFTGSNWSKGTVPSSEEEACITENGTYTVELTEESGPVSVKSLTVGGSSGTQALAIGSSCSDNTQFTTTAGIANGVHGALTLTNGDGCGDSVTVSGPISNAGTLTTEPEHGGSRTLQGNLTNTGTLAFNVSTAYDAAGTTLTNEGTLDLAEGAQLKASGGASVTNGKGAKIAATGTGNVLVTGGTFTEGAGTTSGTLPAIVDDGTLIYNASGGASLIALRGASSLSGTSSSGQSLSIQSTCSENTVVTAAGGFINSGTIYLTNGDGCGDNVTLDASGGLSSSGMIVSEPEHGGTRAIEGSLTNTGTLAINANTSYGATGTTLTNEGALDVATGKALTVAAKTTLTNGAGGSIVATGSGQVVAVSGSTVNEGAGTTSGSEPVVADDAALNYTGAGASVISVRGTSSLSGNLVASQSLAIQSTCSENALATAAASFTNGGAITLTNGDGCGNNSTLAISAGTLTNNGKIVTETAHGGSRTIQGSITNTGTLAFNSFASYNGTAAVLRNEGTLEIAEAKQVTVSNSGSVVNAGGVISAAKGADLLMGTGTSFSQGAGTTSGGQPVIVDDGTLNYTGAGASQIALRGSSSLTGSLSEGQSLSIQSTCGENAVATAAASFTNGGTITLTNGDGCGNSATLTTSSGTFTNSGKLVTEPDHGGSRAIQGNLTNTGTIILNTNTSDSASGAKVLNEGTLDIVNVVTFSITGAATVTNGPNGVIAGTGNGTLEQTGGTFDQGLGESTGSEPVILDGVTLNYTEHGSGPIALRGTDTLGGGNIKVGEILRIESTCSQNASVTAAASFTNNGTLELTNGDGCGNSATLNMAGNTLTNTSTIGVDNPHGGGRTIDGTLVNSSLLSLAAGETLQVNGNYTETSTGHLKTLLASTSSFGALSVSGTATLAGKLVLHQVAPFVGELGQKFAILSAGARTGEFSEEVEGKLNSTGLYYEPIYSATGVTLVVTQATLKLAPTSGPRETVVTVSGSGYLPGDTLELKFSDHHDVKTHYANVTVNGSGEFSVEITIPSTAALGGGEVKVASLVTGAKISQPFMVTASA